MQERRKELREKLESYLDASSEFSKTAKTSTIKESFARLRQTQENLEMMESIRQLRATEEYAKDANLETLSDEIAKVYQRGHVAISKNVLQMPV